VLKKLNMKKSTNLAIVQESAIHLDVKKSLEKAIQLIQQAAAQNAELIVFGESWLSGYPVWLDHCPDIARWNHNPTKKVFARMYQNSVEVGGIETQRLCQMALENKIVIVMGMNEIVQEGFGNGTIYNSFIIIDSTGEIVCHRRKLVPTLWLGRWKRFECGKYFCRTNWWINLLGTLDAFVKNGNA
jgi:nitrilase